MFEYIERGVGMTFFPGGALLPVGTRRQGTLWARRPPFLLRSLLVSPGRCNLFSASAKMRCAPSFARTGADDSSLSRPVLARILSDQPIKARSDAVFRKLQ